MFREQGLQLHVLQNTILNANRSMFVIQTRVFMIVFALVFQ